MQESKLQSLPSRLLSLDAYRGFAMLLMASDGLEIPRVAQAFPNSRLWQFLAYQTEHVDWVGCSVWDLIQPSFTFMVGVAMPFSLASRAARGQSFGRMLYHAIVRSLLLTFLGVFLRSVGRSQTYFTFEDVLSQIGLGYTFLFLLAWTRPRTQALAAIGILVAYWAAFALTPLPDSGFDYANVGVPPDWQHLGGFAAHWDKNTNLAHYFDTWFLNLFPREKPFAYNGGGYVTLSFIPSLVTMIFGLLAGGWLRQEHSGDAKTGRLALIGVAALGIGWGLGSIGLCPVVKRIWTPSWTIFSAGWTCLFLAFFYTVIDVRGWKRWAFPLIVVGMNSITMYCMAHLIGGFIARSIRIHFGQHVFEMVGEVYTPMIERAAVLFILWCILLWLYRRKIFLRL
jgi:heparan-alpha-glucosaminide N-acetyltransferase